MIRDFKNFPDNAFKIWRIVGLTAILHLLQKKNSSFL